MQRERRGWSGRATRWTLLIAAAGGLLHSQPAGNLIVTVGKSLSIDSSVTIKRVSAANESLVDTIAIGPKEVQVNGKAPGETSLIIWQENDTRLVYDLTVRPSPARLNAVREQIARDFPDAGVNVTFDNDTAFVRGTVKDVTSADRIMTMAATLGKTINLLRVEVPPVEPQILLKVRFADVDRSASRDLGMNLASGAFNQSTAIGTGAPVSTDGAKTFSLSQAVNILLFRKDLNLIAAIQALEAKSQLEMLAEPNLLVINGTSANFVAGGEFPYPMVQPGGGGNSITIAFKEYGIRLGFLPVITPRGTIRLQVSPEVSSLDYTNAVTVAGTTVPGTSTRRVQTEVELGSGESFVIAGLLDNQTRESFSKVPGIGDIPLLGKLFQTRSVTRNHSELLVIITPELVGPTPAGRAIPEIQFRNPFLPPSTDAEMSQSTRNAPALATPLTSIPIEQLTQPIKKTLAPPPPSPPAK
jgi:pilus assembly protein CpaC